ncbi:YHS domain-containing (seleno)protein [uncultured Roseobacter sp.]|uniref:YHS domain-containing (seleno)protein n=1 Tax=uncultured Roseobacter sp. TaxID=114847 RepID=UPI00260FFBCD|nr:YHS domain-containing (seleno)protein [uncultured Roseobacter sp.]
MIRMNRRATMLGAGAVLLAGGYGVVRATNGFGLLPAEYAASPVFVEDGFAMRGYDPVAYFTVGEPTVGDPVFSHTWNGATWVFASAPNRDAFAADPNAFAPQYGGFCAWAIAAKGKLYSTQPSNWRIVEKKLYLNYNDSIQEKWEQDIPGFISEGDKRWPQIVKTA